MGDSYGGGIVFYILQDGDIGYNEFVQHGLVSSLNDQSAAKEWSNIIDATTNTPFDFGYGEQNTLDIVNQAGHIDGAANICFNLVEGGYGDWFLPSRGEIEKLGENMDLVGNFNPGFYWSSSDSGYDDMAYRFDFEINFGAGGYKDYGDRVRCIRSF